MLCSTRWGQLSPIPSQSIRPIIIRGEVGCVEGGSGGELQVDPLSYRGAAELGARCLRAPPSACAVRQVVLESWRRTPTHSSMRWHPPLPPTLRCRWDPSAPFTVLRGGRTLFYARQNSSAVKVVTLGRGRLTHL